MKLDFSTSMALWKRAIEVIPGGVQTFSKSPTQSVYGAYPIFIEKGKGCRVWDADGNEYIDYTQSLGPIILGYCDERVNSAISRQLEKGIVLPLATEIEVTLAEKLVQLIPCAEMVKYGKNGSDATSGAVRVARAFTGREKVAICGYHGWHDWYVSTTLKDEGVPAFNKKLSLTFEYNNIESLKKLLAEHEVAAVIMEPIGVVPPENSFLEQVRELTTKHGALLIFDEIITGFRMSLGGAQAHYKVTPDLACFGKSMANGMPISVIAGRKDIMERFKDVFVSFTFGGEALSIAASLETIRILEEENVIPQLWERSATLQQAFNEHATSLGLQVSLKGVGPRIAYSIEQHGDFDPSIIRAYLVQELVKRGVLMTFGANVMQSHTKEDILQTITAAKESLDLLKKALEDGKIPLEGEPPTPIFRKA